MLKTLIIAENPFVQSGWITLETDDILATLAQHFDTWPKHARLYNGNVAVANDVTPRSEDDIAALADMEGPFYAINYAGDPITLIAIAIVVLVAVAAVVFRPKTPTVTNRNIQSESPNNALSGRTNSIRINGRIPDIFGTVRSTPDMIAVPYTVFENNIEVEYTYMCIGRGTYDIQFGNVKDGGTAVSKINGSTVEIFGPNTSPNLPGAGPQLRIGNPISREVIAAHRSKSVNGQSLLASNEGAINSDTETFDFIYPNKIKSHGSDPDFTDHFINGDTFTVSTSSVRFPLGTNSSSGLGVGFAVFTDPANNIYEGVPEQYNVRFYADGRIEFQSLTDIGTSTRPLNDDARGFLVLSDATVTDGVNTAILNGKYVVTAQSGTTLKAYNPTNSTSEWTNLSAFSGGVSPYTLCTFFFPSVVDINVSGFYTITSLTATELTFDTPANIRANNDWAWLRYAPIPRLNNRTARIIPGSALDNWVGPFVLDVTTTTEIIANYVALQGLYKDNGSEQFIANVDIELGVTPCDAAGNPLGSEQFFATTMLGSDVSRASKGQTLFASGLVPGRYAARSRRITIKDLDFNGQISDEIKWRDLYSSSPVGNVAFGDITTAHCVTQGTKEALAVNERQINMLVTRMINLRVSGDTFTPDLYPTNDADEILSFICLDPKIGNRQKREINFDNIYDTLAAVRSYFATDLAGEFNYTIDSDNISFEETLTMLADAVFCRAYRRNGDEIELFFERETDDSSLLFTHRNKVPGSEQRTLIFGNSDSNDGVEYEYVSPVDDAIITYYIPTDKSAIKPKKYQSVGVRSYEQAYLHAWRLYNRLRYQSMAIKFEATQEADLLSLGERASVADNTRPDTQDGEIHEQDGLILTLSQPAVLKTGEDYIISLQLSNGTVENIACTPGVDPYHVVLASPPTEELSVDDDKISKAVYNIVRLDDQNRAAVLITDKDYNSNFTCNVTAVNYDSRYYANDGDFI